MDNRAWLGYRWQTRVSMATGICGFFVWSISAVIKYLFLSSTPNLDYGSHSFSECVYSSTGILAVTVSSPICSKVVNVLLLARCPSSSIIRIMHRSWLLVITHRNVHFVQWWITSRFLVHAVVVCRANACMRRHWNYVRWNDRGENETVLRNAL